MCTERLCRHRQCELVRVWYESVYEIGTRLYTKKVRVSIRGRYETEDVMIYTLEKILREK